MGLKGTVAVVCGGSKGIGKATAQRIVSLGGSVSIISRHSKPLMESAREIRGLGMEDSQFVETIVADATDMKSVAPPLTTFVERRGVPDFLINLVGYADPQYVQRLTLEDFRVCMDTNYYGQLVPILVLLPHFMEARKGHIVNVASMMGYFGIMGYASYAPTKFALVGLSEVLRHELKPWGIQVSVVYPPDTDTPGFRKENQTKPPECAMISEKGGVLGAEEVAKELVAGMMRGRFVITPGESGLVWRIHRLFPWLVRWITDDLYRRARKRVSGS